MLFTQIEFAGLFLVCLIATRWLPSARARQSLLLLASYYFYAFWDWRFLGLILLSTGVDYAVGVGLRTTNAPRRRRAFLVTSLVVNLGLLVSFKYFDFFVESLAATLAPLGWNPQGLDLVLPIGISFYTFQTLSYTIDVYRGRLEATDDPLEFALFVGFFPQLVAGPIVRASHLLPQFRQDRGPTLERLLVGFRQFSFGFFKKVFIADRVAVFVDGVFVDAGAFGMGTTWLAVAAYAVQIYADFSGYSDMAIGAARMLGYDFDENFRHPFRATSLTDFWHRWHISLSTWLRDYLYIPLGGSRRGSTRTYVNLMLTMLLGGLWHGAAFHFLVWGAWHGSVLCIERWLRGRNFEFAGLTGWVWSMLVVLVGWVFFRAQDLDAARRMLAAMFGVESAGIDWWHPFAIGAVAVVALWHVALGTRLRALRSWPVGSWLTPVLIFFLLGLCLAFPVGNPNPFIYFQF